MARDVGGSAAVLPRGCTEDCHIQSPAKILFRGYRNGQVHATLGTAFLRYSRYRILWLPTLIWCPEITKLFTLSAFYCTMMGMPMPACMWRGTMTTCELFPCQGLVDMFGIFPPFMSLCRQDCKWEVGGPAFIKRMTSIQPQKLAMYLPSLSHLLS